MVSSGNLVSLCHLCEFWGGKRPGESWTPIQCQTDIYGVLYPLGSLRGSERWENIFSLNIYKCITYKTTDFVEPYLASNGIKCLDWEKKICPLILRIASLGASIHVAVAYQNLQAVWDTSEAIARERETKVVFEGGKTLTASFCHPKMACCFNVISVVSRANKTATIFVPEAGVVFPPSLPPFPLLLLVYIPLLAFSKSLQSLDQRRLIWAA